MSTPPPTRLVLAARQRRLPEAPASGDLPETRFYAIWVHYTYTYVDCGPCFEGKPSAG